MPRRSKRRPKLRGRKWRKDAPRGVVPREVQAQLKRKDVTP